MNVCRILAIVLLLMGIFVPRHAVSAEKPLWELGIGAALLYMPDYRGSDEGRLYLLPYPYVVYRGGILQVDNQRISGQIFKTDRVLLDISAFGSVPVRSSDNAARAGMPDLDPTFELGPALKVILADSRENNYKLSLSMPLRAFFSTDFSSVRREGWIFSPRLNLEKNDVIPQTGLNLGISAGPMFTDSSYNDYFYAVEPAYAKAARPAYGSGGGYGGSTITIGLSKPYKRLVLNAFASADFLDGAVFEDSPLVKTKTSFMGGFYVSWIFFQSAEKAISDR
ncbi:MAG TPA: MipA/OmpV family protein [Smithellaceae bacterium]|nr:MipA/OmpV family protein [Smithellaceae bacterium]